MGRAVSTLSALGLAALCGPLLAAGPASPGAGAGELLRVVLGLGLVVAVIAALAWGLRRMGGPAGGGSGRLRVLAGVAVGTRERVVLLQAGDTQLLLGVAPGRVQTLHVLDEPIAAGATVAGESTAGGFAERLRQAMGRAKP
ncbi:MAG TPA: flagellar biosynthetic protein FliO [Pseudohaliea sp.]|nr:flagellar biosynthetic protein FliO [Pseudohaliea sp.]